MKKNLLLIIFIITGILNGFGQSKKNDLKLTLSFLPLIGSSDSFSSGFNGLAIKPGVGYYLTDKTSIELNFSFASMSDIKIDDIDSHYSSYAFIPTLRNSFVNKDKLRIFSEIGLGLGTINYNADNKSFNNFRHENLSGGIFILNIGIGGNYYFSESFGLEFIIPYLNIDNITSKHSNKVYSGVGPTIGLTYKLN